MKSTILYPVWRLRLNHPGKLIEQRRLQRGLSRGELAGRLKVTAQTVLNMERDHSYNLGVRMLQKLEMALGVEFAITMKEIEEMDERICMGNDEFILYIRKNHNCSISNDQLGRRIWVWIRDNAEGEQLATDQPSVWNVPDTETSAHALPRTAAQFKFRLDALPNLFRFLKRLGSGKEEGE